MPGKKVVVTGVSSFIGCRLAQHFSARGAQVIGTVSGDPSGYTGIRGLRLAAIRASDVRLKPVDLTDARALEHFVQQERPELWLQHAGYVKDYDTRHYDLNAGNAVNVMPLAPLYKALALAGAEGVIVTGTMSEYGETEGACREEDACWPNSAYGLSKLAQTIRTRQLAHEYGLRTRVARIFIPFGKLDTPAKLLPSAVDALASDRPLDLTPCEQSRDYCAVEDIVAGYERLAADLQTRDECFDVFNLCSGEAVPLKELLFGAMTDKTPNTYYASEMRYPQAGGFKSFMNAMIPSCDIRTRKEAIRIRPAAKEVEFADGTKVHYEQLVSSLPLPALLPIIEGVPAPVLEAAEGLWATSVALVSIGFNRPDVAKHLWFYIYDETILAARVYSPSLKSPEQAPDGTSSLQFEIYYSRHRPLPMDPDHLIEHVIEHDEDRIEINPSNKLGYSCIMS